MNKLLLFLLFISVTHFSFARPPKGSKKHPPKVTYRADCQSGTSQVDLDINNVRADLLSCGDMWWNYNSVAYEVPKGSGQSIIFAGTIWVGGFDSSGNLKLAVSDYSNDSDYYPGPLKQETGLTEPSVCANWDRHFVVYGAEISQFLVDWEAAQQNGTVISDDLIPDNMKNYPARGNPYFAAIPNNFVLPDQVLAPFFDENQDGIYNPKDGDYPVLGINGCNTPVYADQMVFQIFNDMGGPHHTTNGAPMGLEFQEQSFAFSTADELNDMTFYRYKILNRAQDTLETIFSIWIDGDLGCSDNDYVGCDTTRSLVYYYNADSLDDCNGVGYGHIPIFGIDLFAEPLDDNGNKTKMSSFTYINRANTGIPPQGTTDPTNAVQYFNYMNGLWKDGTPLYAGGDGYQDSLFPVTKYAFFDAPDDPNGWSMAQGNIGLGDRRTLQSVGPFTMNPGGVNEVVFGIPWVPDVPHPAPSLATLLAADDKAQAIFDGCFTTVVTATTTPKLLELSVFPNPTSDYFQIKSPNSSRVNLQLVNMSGQVMLSQKVKTNTEISVSHFPQGIYGYQVWDEQGQRLGSGKVTISR